jgi:drug/metabolite transporter (DMT)-like permease
VTSQTALPPTPSVATRPAAVIDAKVIVVWWVACLVWSSTWLFIRVGLQEIPPFTFAWMRLAIALVVLAPMTLRPALWRSLQRRDLISMIATGLLLLGVNYGLVFWGAQFIPSGLAAILQAMTPVLALGLGWGLGSETVSPLKVLGLLAGIAGIGTIFSAEAHVSGRQAMLGSIAVLAGSACVAMSYVTIKTYGRHLRPIDITTVQIVAAVVPLAFVALLLEGTPMLAQWSLRGWSALLYLALGGSVLGFWLNYWLLRRMDASAMLMMGIAEVPIAVLLGAVVLGERLSALTLAGTAVALSGVACVLVTARARRHRRPAS